MLYTATLKGKINGLEETVKALTEETFFYKNEISNLRQEKNDLEGNLARKTTEIRNNLCQEVINAEQEMKRSYGLQKQEN